MVSPPHNPGLGLLFFFCWGGGGVGGPHNEGVVLGFSSGFLTMGVLGFLDQMGLMDSTWPCVQAFIDVL